MLTSAQLRMIEDAAPTPPSWPAHQDFLDLLDRVGQPSSADAIDANDVLTHFLARVAGPRKCGPPPPDTITAVGRQVCDQVQRKKKVGREIRVEIHDLNPTEADDYDLAVDRVMVLGLLGRARSSPGWGGPWQACRLRLEELIKQQIEVPIRRILKDWSGLVLAEEQAAWESDQETRREAGQKRRTKPPPAMELLRRRKQRELAYCGTAITVALMDGTCSCIAKAEDFRNDLKKTVRRCERNHCLAAWDRQKPLELFVQTATVDQGFKSGESFGKTMLAPLILDGLLMRGYVLICEQCGGLIEGDDHCGRCHQLAEVQTNQPWYWLNDQRVVRLARRCGGCGYLYYQHFGKCPNPACDSHAWGRPTQGSVRRQDMDIADATADGLVWDQDLTPDQQAAAGEWLSSLRDFVSGWPASPEKEAISAALWPSRTNPIPDRQILEKAETRLWQQDQRIDRAPKPDEIRYWVSCLMDALANLGEVPRVGDEQEDDEDHDADEF